MDSIQDRGLVRRVIHAPILVNRLALSNRRLAHICFGSVGARHAGIPSDIVFPTVDHHRLQALGPSHGSHRVTVRTITERCRRQQTLSDVEGAPIIVHHVGDSGRAFVLWSVILLHRRAGRRVRRSCRRGSGHSVGRSSLRVVLTSWHAKSVTLAIAVEFDVGRLGSVAVLPEVLLTVSRRVSA